MLWKKSFSFSLGDSMKWVNHRIITTSIAFLLTQNIPFVLGAYAGSTLPDRLESHKERSSLTYYNHRQVTHWFIPYIIAFTILAILELVINPLSEISLLLLKAILGGIFGCVAHIAEDALTGTVPGVTLHSRIGKTLFKTGDNKEYAISAICILITIIAFIIIVISYPLQWLL